MILTSIVVNNVGDIIFDLFITWNITDQTGDIMNAVYLLGSSIAFRAVLALFAGIFVDRFNKKKLIIYSNMSSMAVILLFGLFWQWIIQYVGIGILFILINDINNEVFKRSYMILCTELFSRETFIKFQAVSSVAVRIVNIAGAGAAGFLMAFLDPYVIFGLDILSFVISAALFALIPYSQKRRAAMAGGTLGHKARCVFDDVLYTFRAMFRSKYILSFIVLMFILNLAYGYIPYIFPILMADRASSPALLGAIKSAMSLGEVLGLLIVTRVAKYVSLTFKVSMVCNLLIMAMLAVTGNGYLILLLFLAYGLADSLTQPLFSYTIVNIDSDNRGKIIGGIDAIILFSPSIGMYLISKLMDLGGWFGFGALMVIFCIALLMIVFNRSLNLIVMADP